MRGALSVRGRHELPGAKPTQVGHKRRRVPEGAGSGVGGVGGRREGCLIHVLVFDSYLLLVFAFEQVSIAPSPVLRAAGSRPARMDASNHNSPTHLVSCTK